MNNQMELIKNGINSRLAIILPAPFKELPYQEDILENNWNQVEMGYGTRALEATETSGVNKVYTLSQVFECALTTRYLQSQVNDVKLREVTYKLREYVLDAYRDFIKEKAGAPGNVMNVSNLFVGAPEFDVESKVIIQRFEFIVLHRISLI